LRRQGQSFFASFCSQKEDFFFEKKKQKTFALWSLRGPGVMNQAGVARKRRETAIRGKFATCAVIALT